jgi:hypothetical protein
MTLLDTRNRLLTYFTTHDTISHDEFGEINVGEYEDSRDGVILTALEQLEEMRLVSQVDENLWMLVEPLNANGQDIHITTNIANGIAMVINAYLDANGVEGGRADSLNITEADLLALITIIGNVIVVDPKPQPNEDEDEDEEDNFSPPGNN